MSSAKGLRKVGSFDCPGGGQMAAWFAPGLRLVDIADPRRPREVTFAIPAISSLWSNGRTGEPTADRETLL